MRSSNLSAIDHPQLPLVRPPSNMAVSLDLVLKQKSLTGAISLSVQVTGLEDKEVYIALDIDAGHWSRIMKGDAHFPLNKLNQLMDLCRNEIPLLWLAQSRGYELVPLETETQRLLRLEQERRERAEAENLLLRDLLQNKR